MCWTGLLAIGRFPGVTHDQKHSRTPHILLLLVATALALVFLVPGVSSAQTPEQDACPIDSFVEADGETIDFTAYGACVAAFNAAQDAEGGGLPRTGSDVGMYVGIGMGLFGLGAAFVWGSRRREHTVS